MTAQLDPRHIPQRLATVEPVAVIPVLFPHVQLALICSLLLVTVAKTPWTAGLFCALLLLWQAALSLRLALNFWRPKLRICSSEGSISVIAAGWYGVLGYAMGIPAAAALMTLTLITIALYGWFCHDSE